MRTGLFYFIFFFCVITFLSDTLESSVCAAFKCVIASTLEEINNYQCF